MASSARRADLFSNTLHPRPATLADYGAVAHLLQTAPCRHQHLDWIGPLDHITQPTFWVLERGSTLLAALDCTPSPASVAWIRVFCAFDAQTAWNALFPHIFEILSTRPEVQQIAAVSLSPWLSELLLENGFSLHQHIVLLEWENNADLPHFTPPPGLYIRPMLFQDLPTIAKLDAETFEPLWINAFASIEQAYLQSEYATVAEKDGQTIGYQITTQNTFSAHLGRLAVAPAQQGQGVGMTLVHDMLAHFQRAGIFKVGVNTQSTNQQSLRLYQRAGFVLTGVSFPVYTRKVNS